MAGSVAPFIELGVGFNADLTARENVILNGVLMGLSREQAADAARGGDRVRRARGVRRPEAQELLLGDVGAARLRDHDPVRRRDPLDRRGARGRRRRLPAEVQGRLSRDPRLGSDRGLGHPRHDRGRGVLPPGDVARQAATSSSSGTPTRSLIATCGSTSPTATPAGRTRALPPVPRSDCSTPGSSPTASGPPTSSRAPRSSSTRSSRRRPRSRAPTSASSSTTAEGVEVGGFAAGLKPTTETAQGDVFPAGEQVRVRAKLANRFAPGRYLVQCWVHRNHSFAEPLLALPRVLDFVVYGVPGNGRAGRRSPTSRS